MSTGTPYVYKLNSGPQDILLDKSYEVNSGATTKGMEFPMIFQKQWDDAWSYSCWFRTVSSGAVGLNLFSNNSSGVAATNDGFSISFFGFTSMSILASWDSDVATCGIDMSHPDISSLPINTWTHFVLTYAGSRVSFNPGLKIYANGVENTTYGAPPSAVNTPPVSGTIPYNATNAYIASDGSPGIGSGGNMRIAMPSFWGIELSQSDVDELYNSGLSVIDPQTHSQSANLEHSYSFVSDTILAGNSVTDDTGNQDGIFETGVSASNSSTDFPP